MPLGLLFEAKNIWYTATQATYDRIRSCPSLLTTNILYMVYFNYVTRTLLWSVGPIVDNLARLQSTKRLPTEDLATADLGSGRREFRSGATGVGWSTWLLHPRPLRQFDEEDSLANIVNKVEQAGGYKIFIPSPGNRTNPTYRIDEAQNMDYYTEYTDTPGFGNRDTNRFVPRPKEFQDGVVTFPGYGILGVDSGRQFKPAWNMELYGADWTSANVRMTQKDGFIIVFIPLAPAGRSSRRDAPSTGVQATDDRSRYIKIDADAHAQKDDDDSYSYD